MELLEAKLSVCRGEREKAMRLVSMLLARGGGGGGRGLREMENSVVKGREEAEEARREAMVLRDRLGEREAELATCRQLLEERDGDLKSAACVNASLSSEIAALRAELGQREEEVGELRKRMEEVEERGGFCRRS